MGRPPKRKGALLAKNRTFRIRRDLDRLLIEAAGQDPVSEEIERRLQRSFTVDAAFNSPALRDIVFELAMQLDNAGRSFKPGNSADWMNDADSYLAAARAVAVALWRKAPATARDPKKARDFIESFMGIIATDEIRRSKQT